MTTFTSPRGWKLSETGREPWAHFTHVPGSDPRVYQFDTDDAEVIERLGKLPEHYKVERIAKHSAEPPAGTPLTAEEQAAIDAANAQGDPGTTPESGDAPKPAARSK